MNELANVNSVHHTGAQSLVTVIMMPVALSEANSVFLYTTFLLRKVIFLGLQSWGLYPGELKQSRLVVHIH